VPRFDYSVYSLLPLLGYEQGQNKNKNCLEEACFLCKQEAREKKFFFLRTCYAEEGKGLKNKMLAPRRGAGGGGSIFVFALLPLLRRGGSIFVFY
jgi:hypothetical protein